MRCQLVGKGHGQLLGLGFQADLVAGYLVHLCRIAAWSPYHRLAGKACRDSFDHWLYRSSGHLYWHETQHHLVDIITHRTPDLFMETSAQ